MVEDQVLDRAYGALADPTRRLLLETLRKGDARISDLAAPLPMTFAGVSRHIGVLEAAGVVTRRREGKTRPVHLEPAALASSADWLEAHRRRLETKYRRLDALLATPPKTKEPR